MLQSMSPRDPRLQAAALRLAAERVECGEPLAAELADALANDMAKHPDELDRREREDAGPAEDGEVVMARLLAKHSQRQKTA
jgi:hypothetical protein